MDIKKYLLKILTENENLTNKCNALEKLFIEQDAINAKYIKGCDELQSENAQLRAKLDKAIEDINNSANDPFHCGICKHRYTKCTLRPDGDCGFEYCGLEDKK